MRTVRRLRASLPSQHMVMTGSIHTGTNLTFCILIPLLTACRSLSSWLSYITLVLSASDPSLPSPLASPFPPLTRPSHFPYARSRTILVLSSPHTSHSSRLTLLTFTPPFPVLSCPPHVQPSPSPSPSRLTPARPSLISLATTSWAYLPPPPGDAVSLRFLVL
jgi:hypothetical protein